MRRLASSVDCLGTLNAIVPNLLNPYLKRLAILAVSLDTSVVTVLAVLWMPQLRNKPIVGLWPHPSTLHLHRSVQFSIGCVHAYYSSWFGF